MHEWEGERRKKRADDKAPTAVLCHVTDTVTTAIVSTTHTGSSLMTATVITLASGSISIRTAVRWCQVKFNFDPKANKSP
jgi:hypothetical protein